MSWFAQREGLPETHSVWADPGSDHERALRDMGYAELPSRPAGADASSADPVDDAEPVVETVAGAEVHALPAGRKRRPRDA